MNLRRIYAVPFVVIPLAIAVAFAVFPVDTVTVDVAAAGDAVPQVYHVTVAVGRE